MAEENDSKAFYFEDYYQGLAVSSVPYVVERQEIIEFARKWDPQPFHIDEAIAKASHFGGLTACSAHIFAIFCTISQKWENGAEQRVLASLGFDELRMLQPVFAGDTLIARSTIEEVRHSRSKPDRGIVRTRCALMNQRGEKVFELVATFLMRCRGS